MHGVLAQAVTVVMVHATITVIMVVLDTIVVVLVTTIAVLANAVVLVITIVVLAITVAMVHATIAAIMVLAVIGKISQNPHRRVRVFCARQHEKRNHAILSGQAENRTRRQAAISYDNPQKKGERHGTHTPTSPLCRKCP